MSKPRRCFTAPGLLLALWSAVLSGEPAPAASPGPSISAPSFDPRGTVKDLRQARASFATSMVALGDPRLPDPFDVECPAPGTGRWVDARHWVYDFVDPLPGGLQCRFTLRAGLADLAGRRVPQAGPFAFDTGGPRVLDSLPREGSETIDEEQVFVLRLDAEAAAGSVQAHARCIVEGLAETVPVTVLTGAPREAVLAQRRQLGYAYAEWFRDEGEATRDPAARRARAAAVEKRLAVLRCQRRLPPGATVQLLWGRGIAAPGGVSTRAEQTLAFRVRAAFSARVECARVNPDAGCLPMKPIDVRFTSPVPRELALGLRLQADEGARSPTPLHGGNSPMLEGVRFEAPFAPSSSARLTLPAGLVDDAGRPLENADRFPLEVRVDEYPPLAKFAGPFGILESREGGVLPVTLRNLDPSPASAGEGAVTTTIPGRRLRVGADPVALTTWLRRVEAADRPHGEWQPGPDSGRPVWRELTGAKSVFEPADAAASFGLAKPGGAPEFEVVGLPLGNPGLHVVELQSLRLGRSLLGVERPRYVVTAALVTNLAVHFKWGRESSLAWVTTLDRGQPVAGADVRVVGYCDGGVLWRGRTDRDGIARIDTPLGQPGSSTWCGEGAGERPLLVLAERDADFSFALSSWTEGIAPWDFNLPTTYGPPADLVHTVLDRALFRPGETVSMKHVLRRPTPSGLGVEHGLPGRRKVVVQHVGSEQRYESTVEVDAQGIAEQTWAIPSGARNGDYAISVGDARGQPRTSATFRIADFRMPTMRAVVSGAAVPLVRPETVPLDLHVTHLSGGGAGRLPVTLRTWVEPRAVYFPGYEDFRFGGDAVREGLETLGVSAREDTDAQGLDAGPGAAAVEVRPLTLDRSGAARVTVAAGTALERSSVLNAELEYPDANGELLTAVGRVRLEPASLYLGIRPDGWAGTRERLSFRVVALGLDGGPLARHDVTVDLYQVAEYSYRKRLVGGFYAYETTRETRRLDAGCRGRTDARGELACEVAPGVSGEVLLRAQARDAAGRVAGATTSAWLVGADDWWFGGTAADRMDVLPERPEYEAGETARLQVRMPFRRATALVTVEREGVLDGFVRTLSGREPVVTVPIARVHAPNVFVSVLAVRGRVPRPEGPATAAKAGARPVTLTATVDLNKPAFRLGTAPIRVGWTPHRLAVEVSPERREYRARETARVHVQVKRADGAPLPADAEVALAAVDEGLLELAPNASWQLLEAMMQRRGLQVWTSTAQMQVVGKRHYGRKAVPHGGGGGRERARQSFETLLLWQARVKLDTEGRATVDVPLNDSLSSFRVVAVASAGADTFGTGSASLVTSQELILAAGLPPRVREGDRFLATFTVRNTTGRALRTTVEPAVVPSPADPLVPREVELGPGEAQDITWPVLVPAGTPRLDWEVAARAVGVPASDRLQVRQEVLAATPVRTQQATLTQVAGSHAESVQRPADALPGRGGVEVALRPKLADALDGVRDFMRGYPYQCLEQNLSRAVALEDRVLWDQWTGRLPAYLDAGGLLRYFPSDALPGEDALTAYVLSIAHVAGWPIPAESRERMVQGLADFVTGRLRRDSPLPTADLAVRKLAAIAALARHGAFEAPMLDSIAIEPEALPNSALLDWLDVLHLVPGLPRRAERLASAERTLRSRLILQGTRLQLRNEPRDALWWLMVSPESDRARTVLYALERPSWREQVPRLVEALVARQERGHWRTTTANAWAVLALGRFSQHFEAVAVSGTTRVSLATQTATVDWAGKGDRATRFDWRDAQRSELSIRHEGGGQPWALLRTSAAVPLTAPTRRGFAVTRTLVPVEQQRPGQWTRGDVLRVRLDLDAQQDATWVVVDDPVPAGATILGSGLGGQSERVTRGETGSTRAWPAFEERRFEGFRAYFRYVPQGRFAVEYTVRLDNPGTFVLPPSRVEAMYAPEIYGESPNVPLVIEPR